jgi:hypothetical protein
MNQKKPLPADWLVYIAEKEAEIKKAPNPLKSHAPRIQRHQSRRMRTAGSQTNNFVHAVYQNDSQATPVRKSTEGLTRDLGGNAEDRNSPTGRNTSYRKVDSSNKETK